MSAIDLDVLATEKRRRAVSGMLALGIIAIVAALASLSIGAIAMSLSHVVAVLFDVAGISLGVPFVPSERTVVLAIRAPRLVLGMLVGGALSTSGAAMQTMFRNPLVDPSLIGVSGGAAFGAVLMIVAEVRFLSMLPASLRDLAIPVMGFTMALLAASAVAAVGRVDRKTDSGTIILAGVAVNAIAFAGIGVLTYLATDAQLRTLTFWTLGSLAGASWKQLVIVGPLLVGGILGLVWLARPLGALAIGEREAAHSGVRVERTKRWTLALVALVVGVAVSFTGIVGFVGLVVAHLVRLTVARDARSVIIASAFGGAALIAFADLLARTVVVPSELPLGVVTSAIGGPFFLALIVRERRRLA